MGGGGVQRILKSLKYWDYDRFKVSVLTVKASHFYAEDESLAEEIPTEVKVFRSGTLDPFRIMYLLKKKMLLSSRKKTSSARESGSRLRSISNLLFLPDSRVLWFPFAIAKLLKINREDPVDMIVATMPPFSGGLNAAIFKILKKVPFISDFRDAWTDNAYMPPATIFHEKLQSWFEKKVVNASKGIIFINPHLRDYYFTRYHDLERRNTAVIRNGYDPDDFRDLKKRTETGDKFFRLGIVGTVYSHGNSPLTLLRTLSELRREQPDIYRRIRIIFIGKWSADFLKVVEKFNIGSQLQFVDYLPHRNALEQAVTFDALALAIQSNRKGSRFVTPGRIYEYLYLKKPILAMCPPDSDLAALVRNCHAGEAVDYEDIGGIREVLQEWVQHKDSLNTMYEHREMKQFQRGALTAVMMDFIEKCL